MLIEAMKTLKNVAMKLKAEGKQLVGTLSFDEMAIRRHAQYDHQKKQYSGLIHYGKRNDDGTVPLANEEKSYKCRRKKIHEIYTNTQIHVQQAHNTFEGIVYL